jgi:hypothetical protein
MSVRAESASPNVSTSNAQLQTESLKNAQIFHFLNLTQYC